MVTQGSITDSFQHAPLDRTKASIRLVHILPALSPGGLIQCKIFHDTIDASYQCLSYRWGDARPETPIVVNGACFKVRRQLYDFLTLEQSRLAMASKPSESLWIDALCIDQTNKLERNHQVAQMGRIFSSASTVKVWLGTTPTLSMFCKTYERESGLYRAGDQYGRKRAYGQNLAKFCTLGGILSPLLVFTWTAYHGMRRGLETLTDETRYYSKAWEREIIEKDIIHNDYWSRAWITQEICLARRPMLVLEYEEDVPLGKLFDLVLISSSTTKKSHFHELLRYIRGTVLDLGDKREYSNTALIPLLHRFRNKDCAIPRDRIFSILPLYRWGHLIEVDYDQTDDELVVSILGCLKEPVYVCSVVIIIHSLRPRSGPLNSSWMELDLPGTALHWGPLEIFKATFLNPNKSCKETQKPPPVYARSLERIEYDYHHASHANSGAEEPECAVWLLIRQFCLEQITLVGLPLRYPWEDICIPGEGFELPATPIRHHTKDHPKALPRPDSSKSWRLYTDGIRLKERDGATDVWTLQISLAKVWELLEQWSKADTWEQIEPCTRACRSVRLGIVPDVPE